MEAVYNLYESIEETSNKRIESYLTGKRLSPILVRAYTGGSFSVQAAPFSHAIGLIKNKYANVNITYEFANSFNQKKLGINNPTNLVDWLLKSDIHFAINHLHQGNDDWSIKELRDQLNRLSDHVGYPSGNSVNCPIFTQDKYEYLQSMPKDMVIDTYFIPLPYLDENSNTVYPHNEEEIRLFLDINRNSYEGRGWVFKYPYTTNCIGRFYHHDENSIFTRINTSNAVHFNRFPYALLQPCLKNKQEYKIVVRGYKSKYISNISQKAGERRAFGNKHELLNFAEEATFTLRRNCRSSICDGLIRVDIMTTHEGKMVVNEFEGLEALYSGKAGEEHETFDFLVKYWVGKIDRNLLQFMSLDE